MRRRTWASLGSTLLVTVIASLACWMTRSFDDLHAVASDASTDGTTDAACTAPYVDCNGKASDGCETNVDDDPSSCGACNHSCLDGFGGHAATCSGGACQPVVLAMNESGPKGIALDDTNLYWVDADDLAPDAGTDAGGPSGALRCLALGGGDPKTIVAGLHSPDGLAIDANDGLIFVSEYASDAKRIRSYGFDGTVKDEADASTVEGLFFDSRTIGVFDQRLVYWTSTDDGTISSATYQLSDRTLLRTRTICQEGDASCNPIGIVRVDDELFWAEPGLLIGGDGGRVMRAPVDPEAGPATTWIDGQNKPNGVGIDPSGAWVYWTTRQDGQVLARRRSGDGPTIVVASGQATPFGIAVDAQYVYWTNRGSPNDHKGAIMRVAR